MPLPQHNMPKSAQGSSLRHLPFLTVLAEGKDQDTPLWRDAAAGYLVLRFFDRWLEEGPAVMSSDSSLSVVRERIRVMADVEARAQEFLLAAVQAMVNATEPNAVLVSDPLLAYGKYLESGGQLVLASHVYQTLIAELDRIAREDPMPVASALLQYGYVSRLLGNFEVSIGAYQQAYRFAERAGVPAVMFRTQIGQANTLRARGNLGEAEALLDRVATDASAAGATEAELCALHSRGDIRVFRGQYMEALTDFLSAYELVSTHELMSDALSRERILGDIAACAAESGYRKTARDIIQHMLASATSPQIRLIALGNLLKLSILEGNVEEFEQLQEYIRAHAERYPIQAEHAMRIALSTASGVARFQTPEAGIAAYRSVIVEAKRVGMHHIASKAEAILLQFRESLAAL